jgi:glycosyltransferase involved in cell wall biosynthesis
MDHSIKVLHIIGGGEFGGAEQHILSLMKEFRNYAIDAQVITFYDSIFSDKLRSLGHKVTVVQPRSRFDFLLHHKLASYFASIKPDLVHTHGIRANFFSRLAAKQAGIKHVVTTVHSILRHDYPNPVSFFIAKQMEMRTIHLTEHFMAVSQTIKEHLLECGVEENKVSILFNGIDSSIYSPNETRLFEAQELRRELGIPHEHIVIGTLARLVPVKGLSYLIRGFAQAIQHEPNLSLLIIGEGPEREELEKLARELGVIAQVHFTGFRSDIPNCLAAMDIYVNSSLSEGLPISLMEAMAAEKALVVTHVGGMKEMIIHEENGLTIPPKSPESIAQAILQLANNPDLRLALAKAAKMDVERRFSQHSMGLAQVKLYHQLIEGKA